MTLPWEAHTHLALFVHRVDGLAPGLYFLLRNVREKDKLRSAMRGSFVWKKPDYCPDAMELYLMAEVLTKDCWYQTSDLAEIDEEGYTYIVDRVKDMIISGAENIYTAEVENTIYKHPAILEVAVVAVPDDRWGEAVKACVVLKPGMSAKEEDIINF